MIFRLPVRRLINKSDEELLSMFRSSSDPEILGELYSRYMHLVYGVCMKYFRENEESMDAVIQIFEKLVTEVPKFKIENFRSWLHVVTKNYCLMQIRSHETTIEKHNAWIEDNRFFMENNPEVHPLDGQGKDLEKVLQDCLKELKNEQKDCITLFYYGNKCYSEIASNLKLDEKKVKSHIQNGKRNLKLCIEGKNGREK
jgi:RNA polymerase sigma-70 factor, ECF subfamily